MLTSRGQEYLLGLYIIIQVIDVIVCYSWASGRQMSQVKITKIFVVILTDRANHICNVLPLVR